MPKEQLKEVIKFIRERNATLAPEATVEQIRAHADAIYDELEIPEWALLGSEEEVPGSWSAAPTGPMKEVILYLHGGGYVMHTPKQYRTLTAALCEESGRDVFALDYRRAPEHPFPAAIEDALDAYLWLIETLGENSKIVLAGDSAGGGLAVALMLLCKQVGAVLPKAAFLISPWLDLTMSGDSIATKADADPIISLHGLQEFARHYLGPNVAPTDAMASPLFGDLAGLPPILIHVGGAEMLLDDSTRFTSKAAAAGVEVTLKVWPELFHEWHMWHTRLPEGQAAIEEAGDFIRNAFAG